MDGSTQKRLIARKSDIWHKVEMGILFDAYYDTETTDLSKRFAEITQFGGVITDLAGNILYEEDLRAKVSPYAVISPFAWLVQRLRLEDLQKGDPRPIFMGKVKRFFEYANQLHRAPFSSDFLENCRMGQFKNNSGKTEGYYSYPVENDDGSIDLDSIRIHENLRKFYFKTAEGRWVKRDIKSMSIGYNNVNADDQWLWTQAFMSGHENIFMTHLAQNGSFRLDALRVVEALYCLGGRGENGLKVPLNMRQDLQAEIPSFSMGGVLSANTRHPDLLRDISEGVVLEDGSHVDSEQLHGALSDAKALRALMLFVRKHHARHLSLLEKNSDWKHVVDQLTEGAKRLGGAPPLAYVDKTYPTIDGKMVALVDTDQYRNNPKVAVVWNLNIDPKTYRFNGKSIQELSLEDWIKILESGKSNPNAPLKVIRAHKSPRLLPAEDGYRAGFHQGLDRQQLQQRIKELDTARIKKIIMHALREAYPRIFGADRIVMSQPEEELFDFSTLVLFDKDAGDDVQVHNRVQSPIEKIARDSRIRLMQIKSLWLRAIQFDEDVLLNKGENPEEFSIKIKIINKELEKRGGVLVPESDTAVLGYEDALCYKIKILYFAREYLISGQLQDIGHHFWFEDQDGVRHADTDLMTWNSDLLDRFLKNKNLTIRHEEKDVLRLIVDRMIEDLGYAHILGRDTSKQLDAFKMIRCHGLPHYHGRSQRWYTVEDGLRDVAKLERNEIQDDELEAVEHVFPGMWDRWMGTHHDSGSALSEYRQYLTSIPQRSIDKELLPYVGINPSTFHPIKRSEYQVRLGDAVSIYVPDRYLENPVRDPVKGRAVWVVLLTEEFRAVARQSSEKNSAQIILKSDACGKAFHLANAKFVDLPQGGGVNAQFYKDVEDQYAASGFELDFKHNDYMALIGSGPYPLHGVRSINEDGQTLHLPKAVLESFLSTRLSGLDQVANACLIRDDNLKVQEGPVRLQEYHGGVASGWEIDAHIICVKQVSLADIKSMDEADLARFGFRAMDQAIDVFCAFFANQKKLARDPESKVLALYFDQISPRDPQRGMMFYKPDTRIFSICTP